MNQLATALLELVQMWDKDQASVTTMLRETIKQVEGLQDGDVEELVAILAGFYCVDLE